MIGETIWWIRYKYHIIIMACSPHVFTKKEYQIFTNLSTNQFTFEEKIRITDKQTRLLKLVLIVQKKSWKHKLKTTKMQIAVRFFCVVNYNGHKEIVLTDHWCLRRKYALILLARLLRVFPKKERKKNCICTCFVYFVVPFAK